MRPRAGPATRRRLSPRGSWRAARVGPGELNVQNVDFAPSVGQQSCPYDD